MKTSTLEKQEILDDLKELTTMEQEIANCIEKLKKINPVSSYEDETIKTLKQITKHQKIMRDILSSLLLNLFKN